MEECTPKICLISGIGARAVIAVHLYLSTSIWSVVWNDRFWHLQLQNLQNLAKIVVKFWKMCQHSRQLRITVTIHFIGRQLDHFVSTIIDTSYST